MAIALDYSGIVKLTPEHQVPYYGDVVTLNYPPINGSVSVKVETDSQGGAQLTITAGQDLVKEATAFAQNSLVRAAGGEPDNPEDLEKARNLFNPMEFASRMNGLVQQSLYAAAVMRTHIFPFLAPECITKDGPRPGKDYTFQVRCMLQPHASLTSVDDIRVPFPKTPEVTDGEVIAKLTEITGGGIPWDRLPAEKTGQVQGLMDQVREHLRYEAEQGTKSLLADLAAEKLSDRLTGQPSQAHMDGMRNQLAKEYITDIERQGVKWNEYTQSPTFSMEDFKATMTYNGRMAVLRDMVFDAVWERLDDTVEVQDLFDVSGSDVPGEYKQEALHDMFFSGQMPQLYQTVCRTKAQLWLIDHAIDTSQDQVVGA